MIKGTWKIIMKKEYRIWVKIMLFPVAIISCLLAWPGFVLLAVVMSPLFLINFIGDILSRETDILEKIPTFISKLFYKDKPND